MGVGIVSQCVGVVMLQGIARCGCCSLVTGQVPAVTPPEMLLAWAPSHHTALGTTRQNGIVDASNGALALWYVLWSYGQLEKFLILYVLELDM